MRPKRTVTAAQLAQARCFDGLSATELQQLAAMADEVALPPGYVVVHTGGQHAEVVVVADGEAEVTAGDTVVAVIGSGSVLDATDGWTDVRDAIAAGSITVTALSPMRLYLFAKAPFDAFTARCPLLQSRVRPPGRAGSMAVTS